MARTIDTQRHWSAHSIILICKLQGIVLFMDWQVENMQCYVAQDHGFATGAAAGTSGWTNL